MNMKGMTVLIAAFAAASSFAAPLYWIGGDATNPMLASEANNWAPAHVPSETDDIVIGVDAANRDLTWDVDTTVASWTQSDYTGTVTFMTGTKDAVANKVVQVCHGTLSEDGVNLEVHVTGDVALSSGTWTHQANPSTMAAKDVVNTNGFGVYRLWLRADGNITIGASAVIDVTGKGYQAGKGPSPTHSTGGWHSACHGSFGETPYGMRTDVASIYGSVKEPVTLGSGGTANWASHGGGAVKLTAAGALALDGVIHADSSASANYTGAAGSVWLIGATVGGAGTVTANPGKTSNVGNGGGGRIAVWQTAADATFDDFGIVLQSTNWRGYSYGGTAYLQKASDNGVGELRIPGRTATPAANNTRPIRIPLTAACGDLRFSKVTLKQYANVGIEAGAVAEIGSIVGEDASKNFVTVYGGTITNAQNMASADKAQLRFFNAGSTVKVAAGEVWTVPSGITTLIDAATTVEGDMVVPEGAKIVHSAGKTAESYKIDLTVTGDLTVEEFGAITTAGRGYSGDAGPGQRTASDKKGGSYGGVAAGSGGAVYGSVREPVNYGSGGGTGAGAGAIKLTVGGTATINGSVDSTAIPPDSNYYPGSGGSVWLTTGKLLGTGTVAANGGDSATAATSGGGGRVAVYLTDPTATFDDFEGVISAFGGGKKGDNVPASGPGTVYLATAAQAANNDGTLVIDNGAATQKTYAAEITADVTDAEVGAVEIKASGVLGVRKGGVLKVRRSWSNEGTFVGEAGDSETAAGTVEFVDESVTGMVVGTTAFAGFTCAAAGKRLEFGTGANDLFKIAAGGVLTFAGEEDNMLVLRPAVADTPWNMAVEDGAAAKVSFVDVAWSDARAGATTVVATDSVDSGDNENWSLTNIRVGETIVWKGEVSGLWSQPANWDRSRVPVDTDVVVIPAEAPNAPTLAAETVVNTLVVSNGTSLTLAGYGLTVTNEFRMHGSLVAVGTERIEASGPVVDFSRGGVTAANSTLALTGDGDVAFEPNGQAFATVSIAKGDGDIAFASGFSAARLTVVAPSSSFTFPAGSTVTAGELRLNGAAGDTTGLFLSSAAAGRSWTLTATGYASVFGTGFTDCTAGGLILHAEAPAVDGGNNRNIVFNETVSRWTDGSGDHCFTNELNWSGSVPDRTTRVYFDGDATLTIPEDVTAEAREFEVMDGVSVKVSGGALAVSNNLNVVGATLTLDTPTFVGGNVYLREKAKLAHSACTKTETHRIDLETAGDMEVDATSVIDVVDIVSGGKGSPLPGAPYSLGPSHGGRGGCWYGESIPYIAPCYDSIVEPVDPGTGGSYSKGGGAVKLTVARTLTLNGDILADGGRIKDGVLYYSGSGGSVFLKVGTLAGAGTVSAHGGDNSNAAGAGGRVSVIQSVAEDFSSFTGTMTARSGYMGVEPTGGSGTVYLQSAGQELGEGTVTIDSDVNSPKGGGHQECGVDLPSPDDDPAVIGKMTFIVRHGGCIKLFGDATIGDLILTDAARSNGGYHTQLYLNDHTLHINSREHKNGKGWNGLYNTGSQKLGQILWPQIGLMLLVR